MSTIHRNANAAQAARPFLESLFTNPGVEISAADLKARCVKAGLDVSSSALMGVAMTMVTEGFLERPTRGFYRRPDTKGTPLSIPEHVDPPSPPSPEALDALRFAGVEARLIGLDKGVSALQASLDQILELLTAPR